MENNTEYILENGQYKNAKSQSNANKQFFTYCANSNFEKKQTHSEKNTLSVMTFNWPDYLFPLI